MTLQRSKKNLSTDLIITLVKVNFSRFAIEPLSFGPTLSSTSPHPQHFVVSAEKGNKGTPNNVTRFVSFPERKLRTLGRLLKRIFIAKTTWAQDDATRGQFKQSQPAPITKRHPSYLSVSAQNHQLKTSPVFGPLTQHPDFPCHRSSAATSLHQPGNREG